MISKDMSIYDTLQEHPDSREIFLKHGMHCLDCMGAVMESIEAGAKMHGLNLEQLMAELNRLSDN